MRFKESRTWNGLATHRLRVDDPNQLDSEALSWLREAYERA